MHYWQVGDRVRIKGHPEPAGLGEVEQVHSRPDASIELVVYFDGFSATYAASDVELIGN